MPIPLPTGTPSAAHRPSAVDRFLDDCRAELLNALHTGRVRAGDRLPSIRTIARERSVDHRQVARAYQMLSVEGLVEVRGRSGVYVAEVDVRPNLRLQEAARWAGAVMAEAWKRGITARDATEIISRWTDGSALRCACVESNRDQMTAYCTEVADLTGTQMIPTYVPAGDASFVSDRRQRTQLAEGLRAVDLIITTQYHHGVLRSIAPAGTPIVVLQISPLLSEAVRQHLRRSPLTVVSVTREFGERFRLMYADVLPRPDWLRVLLAADPDTPARLVPGEPVLLTRAARDVLPVPIASPLAFPHSPTLAGETIAQLSEVIVTLNLRKASAGESASLTRVDRLHQLQ